MGKVLRRHFYLGWNFRPGIRTEIVFTLTVLIAGAVALIGILFLKVEERSLLQQRVKGGKQTMASLQRFLQNLDPAALGAPMGGNDSENLQRVVSLFAQSQPLSNFLVVDQEFRVVADSRQKRIGAILRDGDFEKALATGKILAHGVVEGESLSLMKKIPLLFSAPLILNGKTQGGLRGEFPLDDLREAHSRSLYTVFLYILFDAFLLIVVGSFLLSRVIVNPLKRMVQMTEKIPEGDLVGISGGLGGGDEVGKLFSSFNRMAFRLREDRRKMEEYIHSLERVNRELRQAQNEVLRSEKLASIGRLAAGVAHEVGNPTGAILGYLDLLLKGGLPQEEEGTILKRAINEAERIRRIIRELLDFSRPSPEGEEEVDVNEVVLSAFSLISHQKRVWEEVEVVKNLGEGLPKWKGDPHQLQQVMINLFLNAADAMASNLPSGAGRKRTLGVTTRALRPEDIAELGQSFPRRRKEDSSALDYTLLRSRGGAPHFPGEVASLIQVEVEDTGPGITKEALGKIFDPFYSTKPAGEGTGLGLAICLRILESYGGYILVKSEEGRGATFIILLPVFGERNG